MPPHIVKTENSDEQVPVPIDTNGGFHLVPKSLFLKLAEDGFLPESFFFPEDGPIPKQEWIDVLFDIGEAGIERYGRDNRISVARLAGVLRDDDPTSVPYEERNDLTGPKYERRLEIYHHLQSARSKWLQKRRGGLAEAIRLSEELDSIAFFVGQVGRDDVTSITPALVTPRGLIVK